MQDQDISPPRAVPMFNRSGSLVAIAWVDAADLSTVGAARWCLSSTGYATAYVDGERIQMHRSILGLRVGDGTEVDHLNRRRLDNRRANLRVTDRATNAQNRSPNRGHRFCGVYFDCSKQRWRARMTIRKTTRHIGWFDTEEEAGRAVEAWGRLHVPERWFPS